MHPVIEHIEVNNFRLNGQKLISLMGEAMSSMEPAACADNVRAINNALRTTHWEPIIANAGSQACSLPLFRGAVAVTICLFRGATQSGKEAPGSVSETAMKPGTFLPAARYMALSVTAVTQ